MLNLESSISEINRVGKSTAKKLNKLGIAKINDLLWYFPYRYDDFSCVTAIKDLRANTTANIVGQVEMIENRRSRRRRQLTITEAIIKDQSDIIKVIWFNQPFLKNSLRSGDRVSLAGKIEYDYSGLTMVSPAYEKILTGGAIHTQGLVPNYHLTADLTQKQLRFLIRQVIGLSNRIEDWLPAEIRTEYKFLALSEAIQLVHFPKKNSDITVARSRLAFDELFLVQLESQLAKLHIAQKTAGLIKFFETETKNFVTALPYRLTNAQRRTAWEIIKDLGRSLPMTRLLEGDVGSGKTLVACLAMLNVALNKKQTVLMVPTEILAVQHFQTISKFFANWPVSIGLLTSANRCMNYGLRSVDHKKDLSKTHNSKSIINNSDIIIGTHALIQEKIKFRDLGLAIIDEQHRFGVEQRQTILKQNNSGLMPHLLSMTATPIPRTLALALYGDLDVSIINEMPKNRKRIITQLVPETKRPAAYQFIREQVENGRQVFVICPLIDPSDRLGVKSATTEYEKLDKTVFPDIPMGLLHGRLKAADKTRIMQQFVRNDLKILVSTSVIEVGVDVPNATIMMIEGADRFGLAQIHQFRGRVVRAEHQSYCFLFTDSDTPATLERLATLVKIDNGFELAKADLKFRGPGEIYGQLQKGFPEFKIATLFDYALMRQARQAAEKIFKIDNSLKKWPKLKEKLGDWQKSIHLE